MSKGNSNFQHSAPKVPNERYFADVDSGQWPSTHSAGEHYSRSLVSEIPMADPVRSLMAPEKDMSFSSSLSGQSHYDSAAHYSDTNNSAAKRDCSGDAEERIDALAADELVGTVDEAFELLSAYLDDEVTASERCLVQHWLSVDADIRSHYQKQLQLRQALKLFLSEGS